MDEITREELELLIVNTKFSIQKDSSRLLYMDQDKQPYAYESVVDRGRKNSELLKKLYTILES